MWIMAIIVKFLAVYAFAFAYYLFVYKGSYYLARFIPNGPVKTALFRERGSRRSRTG